MEENAKIINVLKAKEFLTFFDDEYSANTSKLYL